MTKTEAIEKIRKLRRLAKQPGTAQEGATARRIADHLTKLHGITEAEIRDGAPEPAARAGSGPINPNQWADITQAVDELLSNLFSTFERAGGRPVVRRGRVATEQVMRDHRAHPSRVHMAINTDRAVCGVSSDHRDSFVWTFERAIAIGSGKPCPHCMETGIIDARNPALRIDSAAGAAGRKP